MEEILQKFSTLSPEKRALLELRLKQKKSGIKTVRMSFAQQRLWFIDQLEQGSISYNIPFAVRLKGKAGFNSLEKCITEIIKRHEILRTVFRNDNGQFLQVISDKSDFKLMPVELKGISSGERYE